MNFSLLISLVFLVLIFIEITLTKNNINSKIFLCCVTVSLLVIYEFYTNSSSLKENFISTVMTSKIPLDSEMKLFEIKEIDESQLSDDEEIFKGLPQLYFYMDNPYSIIGNEYLDKNAYILGNKFLNNSRIMQVNNITKSTVKIKHIGDYLPKKQMELLKYDNNRYGGSACYFKKHEKEIQLDSNLYPLGCGDNNEDLIFNDRYKTGDLQCKKYFEDKGDEYSPEFSTLKCNKQNICDQYSELLFFGGGYGKNGFSDNVSILNMDFNSWSHVQFPSREQKYNCESIALNDKVYFIGGITRVKSNSNKILENLTLSNKIEIYDNSKGKPDDDSCWSYEELNYNLPAGAWAEKEKIYLTNHKCCACKDKILIYGGICIIESFKDNAWKKSKLDNNPYLIIYDPISYDNKISILFMPKNIFKDTISIVSLNDIAVITSGKISNKTIDYTEGLIYLYKKYDRNDNINKGTQYSSYDIHENFFQGSQEEEEEGGEPYSEIVSIEKFTPLEPKWNSDSKFYKNNENDNNFMSKLLDHSNFSNIFEILETYTLSINFKINTSIKKLAWLYGKNIKDSLIKVVLRTKPFRSNILNEIELESFVNHDENDSVNTEYYYLYVIYSYKNIYYMLNIKDTLQDENEDPFSIKIKANEFVNLTFIVKNNIKSSEDMPKVYKNYKFMGSVDTPRPIHLWGWTKALEDNLVWKENEAKVIIEDLKLFNKKLTDVELLNFHIKNFNKFNKSHKSHEPKYSTLYIFDCKNEDSFSSNAKYLKYLTDSEKNYSKINFERKLYHVIGNNYKESEAIFSASVYNNDSLERILVIYNKSKNKIQIKKYENLNFRDEEKLNLNMITINTTKVGDDIIFSGISYDSEKSKIMSNLDLVDIKLFDEYKTPIKILDLNNLDRTLNMVIGGKDNKYFKGSIGGIFVKSMGIVETSEVLKAIKNSGISKYDSYIINSNLKTMYDYTSGSMVFKSNRIDNGINMSFIDEEYFDFSGIKSFIIVQNINTTDLNLSFWFKVNSSQDNVIVHSIEGNWEVKIKDNKINFNDKIVNDHNIIQDKWYFFECSIYPRDNKVKTRLFINMKEAYYYSKMLNKKELTCKLGEKFNSNGDCESCPVNYKGIISSVINDNIYGEDDIFNLDSLDKIFKCVPCPEGKTTFGKTGQTECYDPDFYSEKKTNIGKNTFNDLLESVKNYNLQRNSIKDIDMKVKNLKDIYNF